MARPAEVFVRTFRGREQCWLRSLRRRGGEFPSAVMARRARVIDMSSRRRSRAGDRRRIGCSPGSKRWGSVRLELNVVSSSVPGCCFDVKRSCRSEVSTSGTSFKLRKRTRSGMRRVLVGQFCSGPGVHTGARTSADSDHRQVLFHASVERSFGSGTVTSCGVSSKWVSCSGRSRSCYRAVSVAQLGAVLTVLAWSAPQARILA